MKNMTVRKALVLYSTMSGNTQKVAAWFKEAFEHYKWDVTMFRVAADSDWAGMKEKLYFDDYDVVCLGSPIVGGQPMDILADAARLNGLPPFIPGGDRLTDEQKQEKISKMPLAKAIEAKAGWRREIVAPGHSSPERRPENVPLGVVFTTYGGARTGSEETETAFAVLSMYLKMHEADVVGKFACAGGMPNEKVKTLDDIDEAWNWYEDADGNILIGSEGFHFDLNSKPGPREEAKAHALIADLVEDYFLTSSGKRRLTSAQYISIS